jgi:hypothetical protein
MWLENDVAFPAGLIVPAWRVWAGGGRAGLKARSGQGPAAGFVGQAEVEQAAQVECGDAVVQLEVVGGGAAVAQLPAAAFRADQPGDAAFDHGPVSAAVSYKQNQSQKNQADLV